MLTQAEKNDLVLQLDGRLEHAVRHACEALGLDWADWQEEKPAAKEALLLLALWDGLARAERRG
jgi:hypothetical protein